MVDNHQAAALLEHSVERDLDHLAPGPTASDLLPSYPALSDHLRDRFGLTGDYSTVALLDWTTIRHAHELLTGRIDSLDVFVALADFNTLLGAALFYDRAVVLDDQQYAAEVADILGISDILVPLESGEGPVEAWGSSVLSEAFGAAFADAAAELHNAKRGSSPLLARLDQAWMEMFPEAVMPRNHKIGRVGLSWSSSIQRSMLYRQLERPGTKWADDDAYLVVENDMRALTYENVASMLTGALATGPLSGPNVRYLGGVLRAPMQRALRAQWRDAWDRRGGLPLEDSLNRQWARNIGSNQAGPGFPFWLSAILAGCETPNDLGREVATWRKRTGQLRQRRTAIENELLDGNLQTAAPYEHAITGMVEELPEAKVIAGVTGAAIAGAKSGLMLTGLPPFLADSAGALLDPEVLKLLGPKTSWLMRVTRPRLWFLAKANASAVQLTEPTYRLKELFALPDPPAGTRELLARANTLEWAL